MVDFAQYFPFWNRLTKQQRERMMQGAFRRSITKGTMIHDGSADCLGLLMVISGQLRAFLLSEEGREITIYRLFERDICLFSASCMMQSIQFEISIEAEKDTEVWIIPADRYKSLMEESAVIANYTNQVMAGRFSEVMWLFEQIMWKSFDKRLAAFLIEEMAVEETNCLKITHEKIGNHMGTAREVVTRMLRYFQSEGIVKLMRGTVEITDPERLEQIQAS